MTDEDRRRLRAGRMIEARRLELGLTQRQVVPHPNTYRNLVDGKPVQDRTKAAAERALKWGIGSIDRVFDGGDPTPESLELEPDLRGAFNSAAQLLLAVAHCTPDEVTQIVALLESGLERQRAGWRRES
jgi:hypothetical protein